MRAPQERRFVVEPRPGYEADRSVTMAGYRQRSDTSGCSLCRPAFPGCAVHRVPDDNGYGPGESGRRASWVLAERPRTSPAPRTHRDRPRRPRRPDPRVPPSGHRRPQRCAPTRLPANPAYQHILTVLTETETPLRWKDLCHALDTGTEPARIEGMRTKLKRLVHRTCHRDHARPVRHLAPANRHLTAPPATSATRQ